MTSITIRIDDDIKRDAETLFDKLGFSISGAINVFFRQAIRQQAIPFEIRTKTEAEEKYDEYFTPEMVKSILESEEKIRRGDCIEFTIEELIAMEDGDIPQRAIDFLESHKAARTT